MITDEHAYLEEVKELLDNIIYHNRLGCGDIEKLEWLIEKAECAITNRE